MVKNRLLYNYVNIKPLKLFLTLLVLWGVSALTAFAEEKTEPPLQEGQPLVFIELFSTQACGFCPDADKVLSDIIQSGKAIGFACHVDYFDVREGSLSRPFCSERQANYARLLQSGPAYTPQMVFNGMLDVMGQRTQHVLKTLDHMAAVSTLQPISLQPLEESDHYQISFDALEDHENMPATIWLAHIDQDHDVVIADGANRGRDIIYKNIVSEMKELETWDGGSLTFTFGPEMQENHKGFVVFVQSQTTGKILASSPLIPSVSIQNEESDS